MSAGRPLKFQSVEKLQQKIKEYFENCWERGEREIKDKKGKVLGIEKWSRQIRPYTITGLALHLDTSRQTLLEYEGEVEGRDNKDPAFADTIKRAKDRVQVYVEEYLFEGKNQTGAIFNLKNNFDWKDKSEVDNNIKGSISLTDLFNKAKENG